MEQTSIQAYLNYLNQILRATYGLLSTAELDKDFPDYKLWEIKRTALQIQKEIDELATYIHRMELK